MYIVGAAIQTGGPSPTLPDDRVGSVVPGMEAQPQPPGPWLRGSLFPDTSIEGRNMREFFVAVAIATMLVGGVLFLPISYEKAPASQIVSSKEQTPARPIASRTVAQAPSPVQSPPAAA